MVRKVTMQNIADACGLSRNTISKIFNDRGTVPEATRALVMKKAKELGYQLSAEEEETVSCPAFPPAQNIALLTHSKPSLHSFGSSFITNFTDQICRFGCNLKIFEITDSDYARKMLPAHFIPEEVTGIITLELFDRDYTKMLSSLGIPVLLIDSYVRSSVDILPCDLLCMENFTSTAILTAKLIASGAKTLGFVGDIMHCNSFHERWNGFCTAMQEAGLRVDKSACILADNAEPYGDVNWVLSCLEALPKLPDAFVCANDFLAIRVMQALQKKGIIVPQDVMITGFDGSPEGEVIYPPLTTASIPTADLGRIAADLLLNRIKNPERPVFSVTIKTTPVWRDTIRKA